MFGYQPKKAKKNDERKYKKEPDKGKGVIAKTIAKSYNNWGKAID